MMEFPRFNDVVTNIPPYSMNWGLDHPTVVSIMTEQLAYTLKVGAKQPNGNYHMTVAVTADIPAQRTPGQNESPADKERLDEEFEKNNKERREKLTKGQTLAPWIFEVDPWIELIIRDRSQLMGTNAPPASN